MKSPITSWHGVAAIGALAVVSVGLHIFGCPDAVVAIASTAVTTLLMSMGLMHAGDEQAIEKVATDLSAQVLTGVTAVKEDLTALHNVNAKEIAVHAAVIASVAPTVAAAVPSQPSPDNSGSPHLIT